MPKTIKLGTRTVVWVTFLALSIGPCLSPALMCAEEILAKQTFSQAEILAAFKSVTLFWEGQHKARGKKFERMNLALYTGVGQTPCGLLQSAFGPIFCPHDKTLYVNLKYFSDNREFYGPMTVGFLSYVMGHEFAHHLQLLADVYDKVATPAMFEANGAKTFDDLIPLFEYQADCLAGVYLRSELKAKRLTAADVADVLGRTDRLGSDMAETVAIKNGLQFTSSTNHGTSAGRRIWLDLGLSSDDPSVCEPFSSPLL